MMSKYTIHFIIYLNNFSKVKQSKAKHD